MTNNPDSPRQQMLQAAREARELAGVAFREAAFAITWAPWSPRAWRLLASAIGIAGIALQARAMVAWSDAVAISRWARRGFGDR